MTLIKFLENNENARKIFGEKEIIIIKKQLMGINLTQSEKNRLSRDIRKKLDFIKEFSKHDYDIKLKKSSIIKEQIQNMKEHILESEYSNNIKKIFLFGSTVEKRRTFRSDIDIAVEFKEINTKEATRFAIKFNYENKIQVSVYNTLPEKIKNEIVTKGKIIYEK